MIEQQATSTRRTEATGHGTAARQLTSADVWRHVSKESFAVLSYVTPGGEPRSSGVVYGTVGRRLYVAVAPWSWKARQIADGALVSVTVLVRRGGILALLLPIPPATITFRARAVVHPSGTLDVEALSKDFAKLLPKDRREAAVVLELVPEGRFLAFGVGVSLKDMANPETATSRGPVW